MISIWTIILALLITELLISSYLVFNVIKPFRRLIIGALRRFFNHQTVKIASFIILALLAYAFYFSYANVQKYDYELHGGFPIRDATKEGQVRASLSREQRNLYLSGFTFFHFFVLWRLIKLFDAHEIELETILLKASDAKNASEAPNPKAATYGDKSGGNVKVE